MIINNYSVHIHCRRGVDVFLDGVAELDSPKESDYLALFWSFHEIY